MVAVSYFEIPVADLARAERFYSLVFEVDLVRESIDGNRMAHFPDVAGRHGITGSLAEGESYKPSQAGSLVYFSVVSIDAALRRIVDGGGEVAYPKTSVGEYGFVAEFLDSEGNRIGLSEPRPSVRG